jgi:calcineurin-like phosphoesterase family protein
MIVSGWNEQVQPEDLTYILGDVAFCPAQKAVDFLRRLNGRKILIEGNHDVKALHDKSFRNCFEEIHKYHEINYVDGNISAKVCMFHYRIFEWNQCHRGSVHCFGHQHGNGAATNNRSMDVGIDATGNIVSNLTDIVRTLQKKEMQQHH